MVRGKSSSKSDQIGSDGQFLKQSKMLNYSLYSTLGNNKFYPIGICNEGDGLVGTHQNKVTTIKDFL